MRLMNIFRNLAPTTYNENYGECDFQVCKNNHALQAIQVSYDISAEKTRKREISGLLLAAKMTGCENLLLLTDHEFGAVEESGHSIKIQPVYDWTLDLFSCRFAENISQKNFY